MASSLEANDCYEYREERHSIIEASFSNKTKYEFDNKKKEYIASKRQIDDCVIKNEEACDWLICLKKNDEKGKAKKHLIFVELKDSDLIKAIGQIENSINKLGYSRNDFLIHARIVLTKTYSPDINDNRVKKFIKRIQDGGGTVIYKSQRLIENRIT